MVFLPTAGEAGETGDCSSSVCLVSFLVLAATGVFAERSWDGSVAPSAVFSPTVAELGEAADCGSLALFSFVFFVLAAIGAFAERGWDVRVAPLAVSAVFAYLC